MEQLAAAKGDPRYTRKKQGESSRFWNVCDSPEVNAISRPGTERNTEIVSGGNASEALSDAREQDCGYAIGTGGDAAVHKGVRRAAADQIS